MFVVATRTLNVGQLMLDVENPRYGQTSSQRDAITAVITHQGPKLVALAEHIGENGMNPADSLMVMSEGKTFIVLEGNRRLAAIRLLAKPSLAAGTNFEKAFSDIATRLSPPKEISCVVMASRDEARPWILLRHNGESEGVGVVRWGAAERERFESRPGTQVFQGLSFVDAAKRAYPNNDELQADLSKIQGQRISTLGRLVADSSFKKLIGGADKDGQFITRFSAIVLQSLVERIARDFATTVTVSKVKNQTERSAYIASLSLPSLKEELPSPEPLDKTPVVDRKQMAGARRRKNASPKQTPILHELDLNKLGQRTVDILIELRKIDTEKFPNAAALILRAILELSVDDVYQIKKWKVSNTEFKNRIKRCLGDIDPTSKDPNFRPIRTGLQDSSSLHSVSTLHSYVHNSSYNPSVGDIRAIAANWQPFLQALNDLA
jgi:hypothetical protein